MPDRGKVTIDNQESIEFSNKTQLVINAGAGTDTIGINKNENTPTGLTGIMINGGDPSDGDTLNVTGVGAAVTVDTGADTINGATGTPGDVLISYSNIASLNLLAGIGDLTLTTTGADDTVEVTPGLTTGTNSGTVQSDGVQPRISFANSGFLLANLGGGSDTVIVNGSQSADTIAVSDATVDIANRRHVAFTGVEALTVNGRAGSDIFNVTSSATTAIFIDGGDPIGTRPGDLLNIISGGRQVTRFAGPQADEGSFVVDTDRPVSFDHIESTTVLRSAPPMQA